MCSLTYRTIYFSNLLFFGQSIVSLQGKSQSNITFMYEKSILTKQHLSRTMLGIRNTCRLKDPRFTKVPIRSCKWQPQTQLTHNCHERVAFSPSLELDLCSGLPSVQRQNMFVVSSGFSPLPYNASVVMPDRTWVSADTHIRVLQYSNLSTRNT